ncbi:MAG: hypothetical protein O7B99_08210 [Planctomycetota bacterium]|nr:hypothetical protein [Planctomycetota bacterium]
MNRALGWTAVLLLGAATIWTTERSEPTREGPVQRLLGPVASLAAKIQWIRFDRARANGRPSLAITLAEVALDLDPGDTRGWNVLASYLALDLASTSREPSSTSRLYWMEAGLGVARRGEEIARNPGDLAFLRGVILVSHAENDPELPRPGGVKGMWEDASSAFLRAAELGYPNAEGAVIFALEKAAEH